MEVDYKEGNSSVSFKCEHEFAARWAVSLGSLGNIDVLVIGPRTWYIPQIFSPNIRVIVTNSGVKYTQYSKYCGEGNPSQTQRVLEKAYVW